MPASPLTIVRPRHHAVPTRLGALLLAVAAVLLLSSCAQQRDPTHYSDGIKKNFVEGCRAGLSPTGVTATDPDAKAHETTCKCLIGKFTAPEEKGGVPFKEFAAAQSKIRNDPGKYKIADVLPKYDEFVKACAPGAAGPMVPSASGAATDTTKPDTTKPDTTKPDTTKPDTTKPDTTKPGTADTAAAGSKATVTTS